MKLNEILKIAKENNHLLKSFEFTQPTETLTIDTNRNSEIQSSEFLSTSNSELSRTGLDVQNEEPESLSENIPSSPFKIYK